MKTCVTEHREQRLAREEKIKLEFRVVTPEVRGGSQEELCMPESSYTTCWRGGGQEEQPHLQGVAAACRHALAGLEELFHVQGQEGRP